MARHILVETVRHPSMHSWETETRVSFLYDQDLEHASILVCYV